MASTCKHCCLSLLWPLPAWPWRSLAIHSSRTPAATRLVSASGVGRHMKVDRIILHWLALALIVVGLRMLGDLPKTLLCGAYAIGSLLIIALPAVVMSSR